MGNCGYCGAPSSYLARRADSDDRWWCGCMVGAVAMLDEPRAARRDALRAEREHGVQRASDLGSEG